MALASVAWAAVALAVGGRWPTAPAQAAALVLAAVAGTTLPDLDLSLGLGHRSALTHSLLPVAVLAMAVRTQAGAVAGLALGIAVHLAADCFPNAMRGYATVKLPGVGSIGATASYAWLAANAAVAAAWGAVGLVRLPPAPALAAGAATATVGVAYLLVTDGGWPALGVFGLLGWLEVRRRRAARRAL